MTGRRKNLEGQAHTSSAELAARETDEAALRQSAAALVDMARLRRLAKKFLSHDEDIAQRLNKATLALTQLPPEKHYTVATDIIVLTQLVTRGLKEEQRIAPKNKAELQSEIDELKTSWHSGLTNEQFSAIFSKNEDDFDDFKSASPQQQSIILDTFKRHKLRNREINHGKSSSDALISGEQFGIPIDEEKQSDKPTSLDARLGALEELAIKTGGVGVAKYTLELFPELRSIVTSTPGYVAPKVPDEAPVKWKDREPGETPPDFVRRAYGPWLKDGIGKRVLRNLDPTLITELSKWAREGNAMPDDVKILTVREENRQLLDAGPEAIREHLGKFTGAEAVREARRLTMAKHRSK